MKCSCYHGGLWDTSADLIVAGNGVFTVTHCFGVSIPSPRMLCPIRGLAPLHPRLFFKKVKEEEDPSLDCAPCYHVLTEPVLPAIDTRRLYQYVIARQSVFLLARSQDVELLLPISSRGTLPMLAEVPPFLRFLHPRVDTELVTWMLARAYAARDQIGNLKERLFYLTCQEGKWQIHEPDQEATAHSVGARLITPEYVNASIEGHSHHEMAAFFSGGDNVDEILDGGFRIFFVLGHITTSPELLVRICVHGYAWEVPASFFFSLPEQVRDGCHSIQWKGGTSWPPLR